MKKFTVFTLLLALCITWIHAQPMTVTVSGTVTDINGGAPIPNYPVDVYFDSTNFLGWGYYGTVMTDANGNYTDAVTLPSGITQGTGWTGVRDCTPAGYFTNNFSYSPGTTTISNLNFQICTTPSGTCTAQFSPTWAQGSTLVSFTDLSSSGSGTISAWYWDFGDGNSSTQQNPNHAYNALGTYLVCLTITTTTGCTDTHCDSVVVGGSSGIFCSASLTATVSPSGVTVFSASGSGSGSIVNYTYDFGDGNTLTSTSATVTHVYASNGTYLACVDILFSDSCRATSCASVTIGGSQGCQSSFFWYPDTTGQYSIIVVNTATGSNLSYSWSFGDGSGSNQPYPQHTYVGPGTYVVCLTVTNNNCTSTYCDSIVVVNKVSTPFTINVVASGASAVNPSQPGHEVSLYPNPAHDFIQVDVTLETGAPVAVSLTDLSGRQVAQSLTSDLRSGKHSVRLNTQDLPAGLYLARVTAGSSTSTHKVMIAR